MHTIYAAREKTFQVELYVKSSKIETSTSDLKKSNIKHTTNKTTAKMFTLKTLETYSIKKKKTLEVGKEKAQSQNPGVNMKHCKDYYVQGPL